MKLFLRPANAEIKTRDPVLQDFLPNGGRWVMRSPYWDRRVRDGDIVIVSPEEVAQIEAAEAEKAAATSKAAEEAKAEAEKVEAAKVTEKVTDKIVGDPAPPKTLASATKTKQPPNSDS